MEVFLIILAYIIIGILVAMAWVTIDAKRDTVADDEEFGAYVASGICWPIVIVAFLVLGIFFGLSKFFKWFYKSLGGKTND